MTPNDLYARAPESVTSDLAMTKPTFGQLSVALLETLMATSRVPIHEHGDWPLLQDCWALAANKPAPSGRTEEEVRTEVAKEIQHYRSLKGACCENEQRNLNGGCDSCGDPCL